MRKRSQVYGQGRSALFTIFTINPEIPDMFNYGPTPKNHF